MVEAPLPLFYRGWRTLHPILNKPEGVNNSLAIKNTVQFEKFMKIGESLIDSAYSNDVNDFAEIDTLTSVEAFTLGVTLIFYGYETNSEGCQSLMEKAISILELQWDNPKILN